VSRQQTVVRNDYVVSDEAIVTDVRSAHQEIPVTNFCSAPIGAASVDRAVLTDNVVVPNFNFGFSFRRKRNILRWRTNDRAMSDKISAAYCDLTFDHHVRLNDRFVADRCAWSNDRKWTDLDILAYFRLRIDDRSGMNFRLRHVSDFKIGTSDFL
jgi:hypothetical protein